MDGHSYYIMRKNDILTAAGFAPDGRMLQFSPKIQNPEKAPLEARQDSAWLRKWWSNRSVPLRQGRVQEMLEKKGMTGI